MFVLSTKPLQKLTGTDRQTDRRADGQTVKPMFRKAASPKIVVSPPHNNIPNNVGLTQEFPMNTIKDMSNTKIECFLLHNLLKDMSVHSVFFNPLWTGLEWKSCLSYQVKANQSHDFSLSRANCIRGTLTETDYFVREVQFL